MLAYSVLGLFVTSSRNSKRHRSKTSLNIDTYLYRTTKPKTIELFDSSDTKLPGSMESFNRV